MSFSCLVCLLYFGVFSGFAEITWLITDPPRQHWKCKDMHWIFLFLILTAVIEIYAFENGTLVRNLIQNAINTGSHFVSIPKDTYYFDEMNQVRNIFEQILTLVATVEHFRSSHVPRISTLCFITPRISKSMEMTPSSCLPSALTAFNSGGGSQRTSP